MFGDALILRKGLASKRGADGQLVKVVPKQAAGLQGLVTQVFPLFCGDGWRLINDLAAKL